MKRLSLFIVLTFTAGCASHRLGINGAAMKANDERTRFSYTVQKDIVYAEPKGSTPLHADFYRPTVSRLVPVVLVVHGGGWVRGKRQDMNSICKRLARRGYAVLNVTYRFAPTYVFPAQIEDLQSALEWLTRHQLENGLDMTRLGGFGYSAGGHLVSLMAVLGNSDPLMRRIPHDVPRTRIQAVVAGGSPGDLMHYPASPLVIKLMGYPQAGHEAEYKAASVPTYVTPDDPPFFLYHGRMDKLVEPRQMTELADHLEKAGVRVETYSVPMMGHVPLFVLNKESVERGIDFLDRTFATPLERTVAD